MLIGGIDVSGDRYEGQNNHVALVIGKNEIQSAGSTTRSECVKFT